MKWSIVYAQHNQYRSGKTRDGTLRQNMSNIIFSSSWVIVLISCHPEQGSCQMWRVDYWMLGGGGWVDGGRGWIGYCFKRCGARSQPIVRSYERCLRGTKGCRRRKLQRHICASGFPRPVPVLLVLILSYSERLYQLIVKLIFEPFGWVEVW